VARPRHLAVVTAGVDCPGRNVALRAVVLAAVHRHGMRVTDFLDGVAGLLADRFWPLGFDEVSGIVAPGDTILGASNRDDPFRVARHGIDGLDGDRRRRRPDHRPTPRGQGDPVRRPGLSEEPLPRATTRGDAQVSESVTFCLGTALALVRGV